jgi:hypothetical protein
MQKDAAPSRTQPQQTTAEVDVRITNLAFFFQKPLLLSNLPTTSSSLRNANFSTNFPAKIFLKS